MKVMQLFMFLISQGAVVLISSGDISPGQGAILMYTGCVTLNHRIAHDGVQTLRSSIIPSGWCMSRANHRLCCMLDTEKFL